MNLSAVTNDIEDGILLIIRHLDLENPEGLKIVVNNIGLEKILRRFDGAQARELIKIMKKHYPNETQSLLLPY